MQVSSDIDTESERWNDDTYHYDQSLLTIFTVSVTDFEMSVSILSIHKYVGLKVCTEYASCIFKVKHKFVISEIFISLLYHNW